eukprot:2796065-Ditylum_brightwellii.AAC.1
MVVPCVELMISNTRYHDKITPCANTDKETSILNLKGGAGDVDVKEGKRGVDYQVTSSCHQTNLDILLPSAS